MTRYNVRDIYSTGIRGGKISPLLRSMSHYIALTSRKPTF